MFGLAEKPKAKKVTKNVNAAPVAATPKKASNQADEAKAILEKMEAKKDSGDCPFC